MLACLPFSLPFKFYPNGDFVSNFVAFFLGLLAFVVAVASRRDFYVSWFEIGLLAFACIVFLSGREYGDISFFVILVGAVLSVVVRTYVAAGEKDFLLAALIVGLLLGGAFNLLAGVVQYFDWEESWRGLVFTGNSNGPDQVYGNMGQRNIFGEYVSLVVLSLFLVFAQRKFSLSLWSVCVLLVGLLLALSGSRSVLLYIFLIAGVALFWYFRWSGRTQDGKLLLAYLLLAALSLLVAQLLVSWFHITGLERTMQGDAARLAEWKKALLMLSEAFPFGVGWGGYPSHSFLMQLEQGIPGGGDTNWGHSHNIFLNLLVELGVGAVLPVGLLLSIGVALWSSPAKDARWLFSALTLGVLFIHSNLEYPLWYASGFFLFLLLVSTLQFKTYTIQLTAWMKGFLALLGVVVLAFSAWSAVGYYKMVRYTYPTNDMLVNMTRVAELNQLAANPVLTYSADLSSLNYLRAGGGEERLCRLMEMSKRFPAKELLDGIILDALILEKEELAFSVARSRYRVFPGNSDAVLLNELKGFTGNYGIDLRKRFSVLKDEEFDLSRSYMLEVPKRCQRLRYD